jgi:oligoribonuclease
METIVVAMHKESGLYTELEYGVDVATARFQFVDYIKSFHIDKKKFYLAGNSIWKDREFLSVYMPDVLDLLHYRIVDISTIKTLVAAWSPQLAPTKKTNKHRALDDILGSIEELKWYRSKLFNIL